MAMMGVNMDNAETMGHFRPRIEDKSIQPALLDYFV